MEKNSTKYFRHPSFTAAEWQERNPVLKKGEVGFVMESGVPVNLKVGPGAWNDLEYLIGGSGGNYNTDLSDIIEMQEDVGGLPAGTSVSDIKGDTIISLFDRMLFPTVLAYVGTNRSGSIVHNIVTSPVEVGTSIQPLLTASFVKGLINNGDGSNGHALVGNPSKYRFTGPGIVSFFDINSSNLSEQYTPAAAAAVFGDNKWSIAITYGEGSGAYTDSHGGNADNLDAQRVSGVLNVGTPAVVGRRAAFHGVGSLPATSAAVRALGKTLLDGNDTGGFSIAIPSGATQIAFAIPSGKTVSVLFRESSNANVTGSFTKNTFNVEDAGGNLLSYDVYSSELSTGGYPDDSNYDITVS